MLCWSEAPALFQGNPMDTHSVPLFPSLLPTAHEVFVPHCRSPWLWEGTSPHPTVVQAATLQPKGFSWCGCAGMHELLSALTMQFICLQAAFWWQKWSSSCRLYFCCQRLGVLTASFLFTLNTFWPSEWSITVFLTKYNSTREQLIIYHIFWLDFLVALPYFPDLFCGRTPGRSNAYLPQSDITNGYTGNVFSQSPEFSKATWLTWKVKKFLERGASGFPIGYRHVGSELLFLTTSLNQTYSSV